MQFKQGDRVIITSLGNQVIGKGEKPHILPLGAVVVIEKSISDGEKENTGDWSVEFDILQAGNSYTGRAVMHGAALRLMADQAAKVYAAELKETPAADAAVDIDDEKVLYNWDKFQEWLERNSASLAGSVYSDYWWECWKAAIESIA